MKVVQIALPTEMSSFHLIMAYPDYIDESLVIELWWDNWYYWRSLSKK